MRTEDGGNEALEEISVFLTPSALRTCLIHPDALLLVAVIITWKPFGAAMDIPTQTIWRNMGLLLI
ncbi:hypothetical protein QTP70_014828, partial [Hemibagrus guttatus]